MPTCKKGKGSPYSITESRVSELIPVLGSQPAGDVSHKPSARLPLLSARPAVTIATLKRAATNFTAWWTEAQWVWTVCPRLLPDSIATAIWTWALLCPSPACYHLATEYPPPIDYNVIVPSVCSQTSSSQSVPSLYAWITKVQKRQTHGRHDICSNRCRLKNQSTKLRTPS